MPFSKILRVFQTISLIALFILPDIIRCPLFISPNLIRVQNIVHCVGCHPTNILFCFSRYSAKHPLRWKTIFFVWQNNQISKKTRLLVKKIRKNLHISLIAFLSRIAQFCEF